MKQEYEARIRKTAADVQRLLEQYLKTDGSAYDALKEAMAYSANAGGKRIRPLLCTVFAELFGGSYQQALPLACAVEMVHTYSLIHDDLPCMDNDDYRRGIPSCHRQFGEATALLAGDGLLTLAFFTVAQSPEQTGADAARCLRACRELAFKAGMDGMIGGQVLDMGAEHRKISLDELRLLQKLKTGCLLRAACELGCAAAGATDEDTLARARAYGEKLGLAFQIEDDILDIEGDAATLGKSIGKDAASEKSTFPSLLGLEECRELAAKLTEEAVDAVKPLDGHAFLVELARSLTGRPK